MTAGPSKESGDFGGVMMAKVTKNVDPKGLGRVRLKYPWRSTPDESYWARLAAPMAGPDRGVFFLPEEGDEVLVGFENGDLEHPYVIGGLWNGKREPPVDNADGNNNIRTIQSRAGHEVTFNDAKNGGGVKLETSSGHVVNLSDETESTAITISDKNGNNSLTFDTKTGAVSLSSAGKLTIDAAAINLTAEGAIDITTKGLLTLQGNIIKIN
jgi:uncharacterized protein involved in type VI secretion and phage assembly